MMNRQNVITFTFLTTIAQTAISDGIKPKISIVCEGKLNHSIQVVEDGLWGKRKKIIDDSIQYETITVDVGTSTRATIYGNEDRTYINVKSRLVGEESFCYGGNYCNDQIVIDDFYIEASSHNKEFKRSKKLKISRGTGLLEVLNIEGPLDAYVTNGEKFRDSTMRYKTSVAKGEKIYCKKNKIIF